MGAAMRVEIFRDLDLELHDLCQPLTTLQGRLELAQIMGDEASMKEAVDSAVVEAQRIVAAVARMRERLEREERTLGG